MTIARKVCKIGIQKNTFLKSAQNSASIGRSYMDIWATSNFCNIRAYGNFIESMQTLALLRNQWYCDFLIKYDPLQLFKPVEHAFHEKVSYMLCPSHTTSPCQINTKLTENLHFISSIYTTCSNFKSGSLTYAQATFAHPLLYLGGRPSRPPLAHSGESEQMSPEQMSRYLT